jgi:type I restriction enzyme R subunit
VNSVGKSERKTQNHIIDLFKNELDYDYLGNWIDREDNSNTEDEYLQKYLKSQGYNTNLITAAIHKFKDITKQFSGSLYDINHDVYKLLRYGVDIKPEQTSNTEKVFLINWKDPQTNHFAIAEEVTVKGNNEKRPDIVVYVNGIAIAVIELKRSTVSISDGIRQNIANQQSAFIERFFITVQYLFAGNDTEGLRYGTIKTSEKYYLSWKENLDDDSTYKLDKYIALICQKERFIDLLHNFVLFDGGIKKLPRPHQYFAVKSAQKFVERKEGGIIWHTQGSGKSITMVLLAKWILENRYDARVVIITDRDELDKQIESVFIDAGEKIVRAKSGKDLLSKLDSVQYRLISTLIHKYANKGEKDFDKFITELEQNPPVTTGDIFVFVDECHRTQGGRLHRAMKALMPNAILIGFTGTPLLKSDSATTRETFGKYIHTYKFSEGVEDGVVLDLVYEARDVDQKLTSQERVDAWFEARTKGLNDWQKAALKEKWGTMKEVLSSKSRMEKIVNDILMDYSTKPRLSNGTGNSMLVASSIYEACKYYTIFQGTEFKGKCGVITSYNPQIGDISKEDTGANTETDREFIFNLYTEILKDVIVKGSMTKAESYEDSCKKLFVEQPATMKLLIVVDKLLTGFDAPACTYIYIDKKMQDHGLFQAICRVNRLDGEEKLFGNIVDYKDLFSRVEDAIAVYTSELEKDEKEEVTSEVLMKDRLVAGKEKLDDAYENLELLCEPVEAPKEELDYIHYFCGNTEIENDLQDHEPQRTALYKGVATFIRAFANIADELDKAGYTEKQITNLNEKKEFYVKLRETIRQASGETIDLKGYESDMRYLIDTYIAAEDSRKISNFENAPLVDLIIKTGIADAINGLPSGIRKDKNATAETIENNVRSRIIKDHLNDPAYFEKMSALLNELIAKRKAKAIEYEEYLKEIALLAKKVSDGRSDDTPTDLKNEWTGCTI